MTVPGDRVRGVVHVLRPERVASARVLAVAFDFDDTLVKLPVAWQDVMADYFVDCMYADTLDASARAANVAVQRRHIYAASGTPLTEYMRSLRRQVLAAGVRTPARIEEYRAQFDRLWRKTADELHNREHVVEGAPELIEALRSHNVAIFVVTGGDLDHKVEVVERLNLGIERSYVLGDPDPQRAQAFTKATALRRIRDRVLRGATADTPVVALIGDGRRDMEAALSAGALAIGFNQPELADIDIVGCGFPVRALVDVLPLVGPRGGDEC
jgi:phosphoglycolate phosphatase-like HAD superfamily hydrolase